MTERQSERLRVLFLCTGNSCRSQMAEGWARALRAGEIEAHSAGTKPQGLSGRAVRAMGEAGVDIGDHSSKSIEDLTRAGAVFDVVITLCGDACETCPTFAGAGPDGGRPRVVHVGFDDPPKLAENALDEEEAMEPYRRVRDEIRDLVAGLPESIA